ncbi:helix-turn-helix transcriptional regulator [Ferviditalea candida]|uniref:LuxR C-terminal-related transcriptional regulator n=1 Tax=Ferviditalea candida TaxID=3108399 RepID=A0ABU5ZF36_9BACL|nr:LuxR C-terminal-related transcriptional regulator [Paenibacillaceae bacterium T2]
MLLWNVPDRDKISLMETICESMTDAIVLLNEDGLIEGCNTAFLRLSGYSEKDLNEGRSICTICNGVLTIKEALTCSDCPMTQMPRESSAIQFLDRSGRSSRVLVSTSKVKLESRLQWIVVLRTMSPVQSAISDTFGRLLIKYDEQLEEFSHMRGSTQLMLGKLSKREKEVLEYIALGFSNQEISEKLVISVKTVEKHKSNIVYKLRLKSYGELARFAVIKELLDLS